MIELEFRTRLAASPEVVWAAATSFEGINREFQPWLSMSAPAAFRDRAIDSLPLGQPLFRSWIRLGGVIPVDYDDLCLSWVGERHFIEESRLFSQRYWRHERQVSPCPGGAEVLDRLRFEPRHALLATPSRAVVQQIFRLRHRNLGRLFGRLD